MKYIHYVPSVGDGRGFALALDSRLHACGAGHMTVPFYRPAYFPMPTRIPVRLRFHTTVCEGANNLDRLASEMSNKCAPGTSGAFPGAHDFVIKDSTLNDVKGNYVSNHF